jgi:uncharacterized membrane protein YdjX (TVP38/TMEM64 family)
MPHILAVAAGAITLYYAYRWVRREADRVEAAFRRADRRIRRNGSQPATTLTYDSTAGVYRPVE